MCSSDLVSRKILFSISYCESATTKDRIMLIKENIQVMEIISADLHNVSTAVGNDSYFLFNCCRQLHERMCGGMDGCIIALEFTACIIFTNTGKVNNLFNLRGY